MKRTIITFHRDDDDEWVADLSCGHGQHVRHRPPLHLRPWIVEAEGRQSRLGALLDCPLCERAELPGGLEPIKPTLEWDERTMPQGLHVAQRLKSGTWGRAVVREGKLHVVVRVHPVIDVVVDSDDSQAIPPQVDYSVRPIGQVRFSVELFSILPRLEDKLGSTSR